MAIPLSQFLLHAVRQARALAGRCATYNYNNDVCNIYVCVCVWIDIPFNYICAQIVEGSVNPHTSKKSERTSGDKGDTMPGLSPWCTISSWVIGTGTSTICSISSNKPSTNSCISSSFSAAAAASVAFFSSAFFHLLSCEEHLLGLLRC